MSMPIEKVIYKTSATSTGGRTGTSKLDDGTMDVTLTTPKEMGGAGGAGTNPEQLFAMGYSACFLGALKAVGRMQKVAVPEDATVQATIGFGQRTEGGYGITADLKINIPGMDRDTATKLVEAAHQVCPYSNATRNNVNVGLTVA
jgi:osmotically inducible protein OsmC